MARVMYPRMEHIKTVYITLGHQPLMGCSFDNLSRVCSGLLGKDISDGGSTLFPLLAYDLECVGSVVLM